MDAQENTCLVCHEIVSVFAIGKCDHPICYKCSTRMRVLCEQMYCAICRSDLPEVYFVRKQAKFAAINKAKLIPYRHHKIFFEDFKTEETFKRLQENNCKICKDRPSEKTFRALKDHMRKEHTLFCCDLCLQHLKIFSLERKFYNRHDLAVHRRTGDKDDKSYKGHPLCKFCDERYMDNDELLRHLRKDHYFCHFCDEGSNEYYNDYEDLRQHFQAAHFLCELDDCIDVKFTNAFRTNIDLKAHVAKEHHQKMNKAQVKEARTIDVNFQLAPRARGRTRGPVGLTSDDYEDASVRGSARGYRGRSYRGGHDSGREREERMQMERAREASIQESLRATEREMKEITRKRREAQEKEERRFEEERIKKEMESIERDFPSLAGGPPAPSIVPPNLGITVNKKQSKDNKSKAPMAKRVGAPGRLNSTEYPSLSGSRNPTHKPSTDRDSPVTTTPRDVIVPPPSNIQTVPQSLLDAMRQEQPAISKKIPERTSEDFPSLSNGSQRGGSANLRSLGVWSAKSRKNELQMDNSNTYVPQQNTSLASLGQSLCGAPSYTAFGGKKAMPNSSQTMTASSKVNSAKSKGASRKQEKDNIEKPPPPKTKDKGPVEESEDVQSKKSKKKKKQKEQKNAEAEKPSSAGSTKEAKSKKSKSTDPVSKMFSEPDRDSGIESSSGSVESATVLPFKTEEPAKVESRTEAVTAADLSIPAAFSSAASGVGGSSLDGIAVGLLGTPSASTQEVPVLNDFPSLNGTTSVAPPPGFKPSAPPGFDNKKAGSRPPPGFTSLSEDTKKCSPLTSDFENFVYSKPANFTERNKKLVQSVSSLLGSDQDKFQQFKTYSGSFRAGNLDSLGYYISCQELLGHDNFSKIAPELIALLPDINKQQDLLAVHKESLRENAGKPNVLRISGKAPKAPWSVTSEFKTCPSCRQVLLQPDFQAHISEHGGMQDFPSLGSKGHQPGFLGQGSWIKAK